MIKLHKPKTIFPVLLILLGTGCTSTAAIEDRSPIICDRSKQHRLNLTISLLDSEPPELVLIAATHLLFILEAACEGGD